MFLFTSYSYSCSQVGKKGLPVVFVLICILALGLLFHLLQLVERLCLEKYFNLNVVRSSCLTITYRGSLAFAPCFLSAAPVPLAGSRFRLLNLS